MGILSEIRHLVSKMEKGAQAPGFIPTPLYYASMQPKSMSNRTKEDWTLGGKLDSEVNASNMYAIRGASKGVAYAIPSLSDFAGGSLYGLGKGLFHFFKRDKGFRDGYSEGGSDWKKYISDPMRSKIRTATKPIKNKIDNVIAFHENNAGGHNPYNDLVEPTAEGIADLAVGWYPIGKMMGLGWKGSQAAGKILGKVPVAGKVLSKIPAAGMSYMIGEPLIDLASEVYSGDF